MSTPVLQLIEARVAAEADQAIDVGYVMRSTSITVDGLRYKRCLAKQRYGVTDVRFEADGSKIKSILASFKQDSSGNLQRYHINARIGHSVVSATFETDKLLRKEFIKRCTDLVQAAKRKGSEANARVANESPSLPPIREEIKKLPGHIKIKSSGQYFDKCTFGSDDACYASFTGAVTRWLIFTNEVVGNDVTGYQVTAMILTSPKSSPSSVTEKSVTKRLYTQIDASLVEDLLEQHFGAHPAT